MTKSVDGFYPKSFVGIFFLLCLFSIQTAHATVSYNCKVQYKTGYSWSTEYMMEVAFLTGSELNRATSTFRFSSFKLYALIWFGEGEVAILEHDGMAIIGGTSVDTKAFKRVFQVFGSQEFTQVNDDNARKWKVTCKEFGRFVDPRVP